MKISWKKQYEIGNTEIDSEHKVFVEIIKKIKEAINRKAAWKDLNYLLEELLKYADFHFCSEENVMRFNNYPDLDYHHQVHNNILIELRQKIFTLQGKKYEKATELVKYEKATELVSFLMHWFLNHTLNQDRKIATYLDHLQTDD